MPGGAFVSNDSAAAATAVFNQAAALNQAAMAQMMGSCPTPMQQMGSMPWPAVGWPQQPAASPSYGRPDGSYQASPLGQAAGQPLSMTPQAYRQTGGESPVARIGCMLVHVRVHAMRDASSVCMRVVVGWQRLCGRFESVVQETACGPGTKQGPSMNHCIPAARTAGMPQSQAAGEHCRGWRRTPHCMLTPKQVS